MTGRVAVMAWLCLLWAGCDSNSTDRQADSPSSRPSGATAPAERSDPPAERPEATTRSREPEVYTAWPFSAAEAKRRQAVTAEAMGLPEQRAFGLGSGVTMDVVLIPAGDFMMGSPRDEAERDDDEQLHPVTIARPYYMGATEVTQAQWRAVMGSHRGHFKGAVDLPVEMVSWTDATAFCRELSETLGRDVHLPTEAQWEYACRAGMSMPFHTGETLSTGQANYDGHYPYRDGRKGMYREKTTPVGSFAPNAFGLYDMHGNVWEWCSDRYGDYDAAAPVAGRSEEPQSRTIHVLRGGCWCDSAGLCRSANRSRCEDDAPYFIIGFRVVVEADGPN